MSYRRVAVTDGVMTVSSVDWGAAASGAYQGPLDETTYASDEELGQEITGVRSSWHGQSMTENRDSTRLRDSGALVLLFALGAAAFTLPGLGFFASVAIPFVAHWQRRVLWPHASSTVSWIYSFLALAGLWWTAVASFLSPLALPFAGIHFGSLSRCARQVTCRLG